MSVISFDNNAAKVKAALKANKGLTLTGGEVAPKSGLLSAEAVRAALLNDMKSAVSQVNSLRKGDRNRQPIDLDFGSYVDSKFGFASVEGFYDQLLIDPSTATVSSLMNMPEFDEGYRWLVPEIIRESVRLGLRRNPVHKDLIAGEETVTQNKVTLPHINMSDAKPSIIGETETIPTGSVSFGDKDVRLNKIGTGLKISDEVQKQVSLNILSLYLQDAGVKLNLGLDTMAIDVALNGEDVSGAYSAAVIGVETIGVITYKDILRAWLRMGRIGRMPTAMVSNEDPALDILMMDEFRKWSGNTNTAHKELTIKTPIPQSQDYLIHGAMPAANRIMLIDKTSAMIKLNSSALVVENERIAERQLNGTYMTLTTGFATLFRDSRVIIDSSIAYSAQGFPSWMDIGSAENVIIS